MMRCRVAINTLSLSYESDTTTAATCGCRRRAAAAKVGDVRHQIGKQLEYVGRHHREWLVRECLPEKNLNSRDNRPGSFVHLRVSHSPTTIIPLSQLEGKKIPPHLAPTLVVTGRWIVDIGQDEGDQLRELGGHLLLGERNMAPQNTVSDQVSSYKLREKGRRWPASTRNRISDGAPLGGSCPQPLTNIRLIARPIPPPPLRHALGVSLGFDRQRRILSRHTHSITLENTQTNKRTSLN
jgi:hypothetical protein